jgi:mRNA interferase MazF
MDKKKIVLTRFPFTDLTTAKRRPAVVLTSRKKHASDVIVAFISSVVPPHLADTEFVLDTTHPDFGISGLRRPSVFKMDKLATLDVAIFTGELGEVSDAIFDQLKERLKKALEL